MITLLNLSSVFVQLQDWRSARECCEKALPIARKLGNETMEKLASDILSVVKFVE
jgi:hypothetical protein